MTAQPQPVHSLAEAHLYLMVCPCPECGRGSLKAAGARPDGLRLSLRAACGACGRQQDYEFVLTEGTWPEPGSEAARRINTTGERSAIIDVAGWLTLFRVILEGAGKAADKGEARMLGHEAAQCLEEALKFYSPDSDLPPAEAFFSENSRRLLRDHPEQFTRQRLLGMRHKLPTLRHMEHLIRAGDAGGRSRPWWRFWKQR